MTEQPTLCLTASDELRREPKIGHRLDTTLNGYAMALRPSLRRHGQVAAGVWQPHSAPSPVKVSADPIGRHAPLGLPCQIQDPDLWFAEAPAALELAKALCTGCPAQQMCLAGALDRQEPFGVWGGQIFQHGRIVSHKRARGRPRKDSTPVSIWG